MRESSSAGQPDAVVPARWTVATVYDDMWVDPDDDPRETEAELLDERTTLVEYLRVYRLTLEMKCAGLDAEQLARRSVPPSTMSLLGLVRHLAQVERNWFRRVMARQPSPTLYSSGAVWGGPLAGPEGVSRAWQDWR